MPLLKTASAILVSATLVTGAAGSAAAYSTQVSQSGASDDVSIMGYVLKRDWGGSYVWGTKSNTLFKKTYEGMSRANGNVYDGKRIISVCSKWRYQGKTYKTCSDAVYGNGRWHSGGPVVNRIKVRYGQDASFTYNTTRLHPSAH